MEKNSPFPANFFSTVILKYLLKVLYLKLFLIMIDDTNREINYRYRFFVFKLKMKH